MLKTLAIIFVAVNSLLVSCVNTEAKANKEKMEDSAFNKQWATNFLDSINTKFSEQIADGDSSALASHHWPDAELLLDNSEPVKGDKIENAWANALQMGVKEMTFSTTDIKGSSTFIIETGAYEMKGLKNSLMDKGKYVVVWEKRNGEWKLYRDIGCTSLPAPK
jgi:ketosteroid isomerase-like protein